MLAHELGHHTGGHAWAGLLGYWYSLPGRIAWAVTRTLAAFALLITGYFSVVATLVLGLFMALAVFCASVVAWYIVIPLVLAPFLLAYAGRRGELRADQQRPSWASPVSWPRSCTTWRPSRPRRRPPWPRRARSSRSPVPWAGCCPPTRATRYG